MQLLKRFVAEAGTDVTDIAPAIHVAKRENERPEIGT
jgi:hypothetical protein